MKRRPNVVFVITDDQGYPPLGCHGHPFIQTPHLDAFHGESVRFESFHTGTTCAPTRAGLMTGHYCNSTGVWHTIGGRSLLRRDEWSLGTALSEAGYRTGLFGKWHLGDSFPYRPQDRGFQRVVCHGGGGISQQPDWWGNDYFDDTYMVDGEPKAYKGYCTDVFFSEALDFIEANKDVPFFAYISTNAPHGPWNVEPDYRDLYTDNTDSEAYARFLGMITNIDENFGKLREKLCELKIEDNTILIFMSDNGMTGVGDPDANMYMGGMRGFKGSPYDGGHRVPFFIRWPDGSISTARSVEELTSYVDFMPTLLDLCDVEVPDGRTFHGESLRPLIEGNGDTHWADRVITTDTQRVAHPLKWRHSCVMKDTLRLVNKTELYDIAADPGQQNDIGAQHPDVVKALQEGYEEWWSVCSAQDDDDIPISIGSDAEEVTTLRTHDLRNEQDHLGVWDQSQVRAGDMAHGWWEIMVEQDGEYEFDLRRWPEEAGHKVQSGIEGADVTYYEEGVQPGRGAVSYSGGVALDIDTAGLFISGFPERWTNVGPEDQGAVFRMKLPAGARHLRAQFSAAAPGFYSSAYYVYVRRVG